MDNSSEYNAGAGTWLRHDSRSRLYREPFGARPAGSRVTLRLGAGDGFARAWVRAWFEGGEKRFEMRRYGRAFEADLSLPDRPGVFWYYFIAEDEEGRTALYGNAPDGLGGEGAGSDREPGSFQITLYDPEYDAPHWMRESALYQIFPDRFASGRENDPQNLAPGCRYHTRWDEEPDLRVQDGDNEADDFFGGDFAGMTEKLPYLKELGIGCIYLNPVFQARSNHKYNTGDYKRIDPSFGTEADFRAFCERARSLGIRVLLDGVFSHTGSDSLYFDREGTYGGQGAYRRKDSPYASWYRFERWPDRYDCWWGFPTLPNVNERDEGFLNFILRDADAVATRWLRMGASGWRLDVADELPMEFLREMRLRVKSADPQAAILGEVWEDASRKEAYGELRAYCAGDTLDGVMNYPLRDALTGFLLFERDALSLERTLEALREAYPKPFFYSLMNLLGSHDKPRAISVLSGAGDMEPPRENRRAMRLSSEQYAVGRARYIAALRFTASLPGMPSVYYGDEAGMTGMADPFCRGTYPWGREDGELVGSVREILTRREPVCKTGFSAVRAYGPDVVLSVRWLEDGKDAFGQTQKGPSVSFTLLNRLDHAVSVTVDPGDVDGLPIDAPVALMAEPIL